MSFNSTVKIILVRNDFSVKLITSMKVALTWIDATKGLCLLHFTNNSDVNSVFIFRFIKCKTYAILQYLLIIYLSHLSRFLYLESYCCAKLFFFFTALLILSALFIGSYMEKYRLP